MSLGFLVSRFGVWLHELGSGVGPGRQPPRTGASFVLGEVMMGLGGSLALLAAWRYHTVNRDIERGRVSADRWLIATVTIAVAVLTAAMIVYMRLTTR